MKNSQYRLSLILPVELENNAKEKAYNIGLRRGRAGNLSGYIRTLIFDDLKSKLPLNTDIQNTIDDTTFSRAYISLPREMEVKIRDRAKELGFVRSFEGELVGNVSGYILYLLIRDCN